MSPNSTPNPPSSEIVRPQNRQKHLAFGGALVVIAILIVVSIVVFHHEALAPNATSGPYAGVVGAADVSITASGFTPATIKVTPGTVVTWTNDDTKTHWIASDPFPTDNNLSDLNSAQALQPGDSYSFTFPAIGNYSYHDELNPYSVKGMIMVSYAASTAPQGGHLNNKPDVPGQSD